MVEIWKDIKGFEGHYQVSNIGRVRSLDRVIIGKNGYTRKCKSKILTQRKTSGGGWYYNIGMSLCGKSYSKDVHRLVAETFIDRVDGKNYVNHIDNNPINNHVDNLEWCTQKENVNHCVQQGRLKPINGSIAGSKASMRKVKQMDKYGNILKIHNSLTDGANSIGVNISTLHGALNGRQHTSGGYKWEYI